MADAYDLTAAEFLTAEDGAAASGEAPPQPSASEWAQWDAMEAEGILPPLPPPALFDPWDRYSRRTFRLTRCQQFSRALSKTALA